MNVLLQVLVPLPLLFASLWRNAMNINYLKLMVYCFCKSAYLSSFPYVLVLLLYSGYVLITVIIWGQSSCKLVHYLQMLEFRCNSMPFRNIRQLTRPVTTQYVTPARAWLTSSHQYMHGWHHHISTCMTGRSSVSTCHIWGSALITWPTSRDQHHTSSEAPPLSLSWVCVGQLTEDWVYVTSYKK